MPWWDDEDDDSRKDVVIDNGTGLIKAGFSGAPAPGTIFRSCIGLLKPEAPATIMGKPAQDVYVGPPEMLEGYLKLTYPIQSGMIDDWDVMEQIWDHTFSELDCKVGQHDHLENSIEGVFLTEAARNPNKVREKSCEMFFENYTCSRFFLATQAVLAMYSSGRLTGVALDVGAGVTHSVPIYEGYTMGHAVRRSNVAGRDLTTYMVRCLAGCGIYLTTSAEKEIARRIKEEHCYVAMDYDSEVERYRDGSNPGVTYFMPDGQSVRIKETMCQVPEFLFNPMKLENIENRTVHELTADTIKECDLDVRRTLYDNIILSGGTTLIPGFADRLESEVQKLAPINAKVRVSAPDDRYLSVWMGGAILSSLSTFEKQWIYRVSDHNSSPPVHGYDEYGPRLVHMMCQM